MRVEVHVGEPADSVLHRLASRWDMPTRQFQRLVGIKEVDRRRGHHAGHLARLLGRQDHSLGDATPVRQTRRRVRIGQAWTDAADMAPSGSRYCPACFREDVQAWSRMEWRPRSIVSCIRHERLLLDHCVACGASASLYNPEVFKCHCGADLREAEAPAFSSQADRLLQDLISSGACSLATAEIGLHQLSGFLARLGTCDLGWHSRRPTDTFDILRLRETGINLASSGEELVRTLDAVVEGAPPGACGLPGLTSSYGWIWRAWLSLPSCHGLEASTRKALLAHAEAAGVYVSFPNGGVTLASTLR